MDVYLCVCVFIGMKLICSIMFFYKYFSQIHFFLDLKIFIRKLLSFNLSLKKIELYNSRLDIFSILLLVNKFNFSIKLREYLNDMFYMSSIFQSGSAYSRIPLKLVKL